MTLIHPTAILAEGARLGRRVRIGPFAVIESETLIGDDSEVRAHAVVKRYTTLDNANHVHEGAVIGGEPQDLAFVRCKSYLRIGSRNRIREGATIHRGTTPESSTVVGSECFIMVNAHVAHDSVLGDNVILANNVALAGHVSIGDRAFLSGGVVVHQFCRVGRLAIVGGNSKIVQDCLPFIITDGVPGRAHGLNLIGLRRAGIAAQQIRRLKEAYRILIRSGLPLETALDRMTELDDPLVGELAEFAGASTRGFCRG